MTNTRKLHKDTLPYGIALTALVAAAGFFLSSRNLHSWGMTGLGESWYAAWALPIAFDLAPLALTLIVFSASLAGRSAIVWRLGIFAFAGLSAWINWVNAPHTDGHVPQIIAVLLPLSAVAALEGIFYEIKKRALKDEVLPRIPLIAWVFAPRRAKAAYVAKALRPLVALETALRETPTETPKPLVMLETVRLETPKPLETVSRPPRPSKPRGLDPELRETIASRLSAGETAGEIFESLKASSTPVGRATIFRIRKEIESA